MAVKLRLTRKGAKHKPYYKIIVADSRSPRDGKFIEVVGSYDPKLPRTDANRVKLDSERIKYWISVGAVATDTVQRFIDPIMGTNKTELRIKKAKLRQAAAKPKTTDADQAATEAGAVA